MVLRYKEEYERLGPGSAATDLIEDFFDEALGVCEEAAQYTIIRNSAMCLKCNEHIESIHRHDFVVCKCGNIGVDGGKDYLRRMVEDDSKYKDTSITYE